MSENQTNPLTVRDLMGFLQTHDPDNGTEMFVEIFDGQEVSTIAITDITLTISTSGYTSLVFNKD